MKKILEKSGNFVRGKKWEPCQQFNKGTQEVLKDKRLPGAYTS